MKVQELFLFFLTFMFFVCKFTSIKIAQMAELVDALASGASTRKGVEVRVLFWAPSDK